MKYIRFLFFYFYFHYPFFLTYPLAQIDLSFVFQIPIHSKAEDNFIFFNLYIAFFFKLLRQRSCLRLFRSNSPTFRQFYVFNRITESLICTKFLQDIFLFFFSISKMDELEKKIKQQKLCVLIYNNKVSFYFWDFKFFELRNLSLRIFSAALYRKFTKTFLFKVNLVFSTFLFVVLKHYFKYISFFSFILPSKKHE